MLPKQNMAVDLAKLDEPTLAALAGVSKENGLEHVQVYEKSVNQEKFIAWLGELKAKTGDDGQPDYEVRLDREKILTVGRPAIGRFLLALQTYKSLGDLEGGSALFERYSAVSPSMLAVRAVVMARKEPRKLLVQPHLHRDAAGATRLATFAATPAGLIESFVARYPAEDPELLRLYEADLPYVAD